MTILWIAGLVFAASMVGTISGFGLSTILVPTLLLIYPGQTGEVLLFVGVIHFFGDVWKLALFGKSIRWKLILLFGVPGVVCAWLGSMAAFSFPEGVLPRVLGGFLIGYSLLVFSKPEFKIPQNNMTAAIGGGSSGFLAGIFGMGGAIRTMFLTAYDLEKHVYIAASGGIALLIDFTRLGGYLSQGAAMREELAWGLLLFVPVSLGGAATAKRIVHLIPDKYFRGVIAGFLVAAGLKILIWPG